MTNRRSPRGAAWLVRSGAILLVALMASVGSPAGAAGAVTPPELTDAAPTTTAAPPITPSAAPLTTAAPHCDAPPTGTAAPCLSASPPASPTSSALPPTTSVSPAVTPTSVIPTSVTPTSDAATSDDDGAGSTAGPQYGTVARPVIRAGQQQTATGHNFAAGTRIRVTLLPEGIDLGTHTAAPDGTVTTQFATTGVKLGNHTVRWTAS
jgi:hypothetical protein